MSSSIFCSSFGFSIGAVSTAGTKLVVSIGAKMFSLANGEFGLYCGLGRWQSSSSLLLAFILGSFSFHSLSFLSLSFYLSPSQSYSASNSDQSECGGETGGANNGHGLPKAKHVSQ